MIAPLKWQRLPAPALQQAVCFRFSCAGFRETGFVIRLANGLRAYRNRCPHAGTTLDWVPGRFFNEEGLLQCHTHGACFDPDTGAVLAGPARRGLEALPLRVHNDCIEVPAAYEAPPWPTA